MHRVGHAKSKLAGVGRRKCFIKESKLEFSALLTWLHSASILLAFAPKNRHVRTGKISYEHSV